MSSTLCAALLLAGVQVRQPRFDEIQVRRLNIVEPDGTLRMVISDKARLPPVIIRGREHPEMGEPRPQAGLIFYNDEGTENGGLIFSGRKNERGEVVDAGASLSFDKYGANQIVQLAGVDDSRDRFAGLTVSDQSRRVWVGRTDDGKASVTLMDAAGRPRIVMQVTKQGDSMLVFKDEEGHIVRKF